jgi:PDZ domain-containing protein
LKAQITPFRVAVGLLFALFVTVIILLRIPSGDTLLLPDVAHPVARLVQVQGSKPAKGGGDLYFVDVQEQQASEFDKLFPWIHPHSSLVPTSELVPPGSNSAASIAVGLREMSTSQKIAAAVALRHLGYHVVVHENGVLVNQIILGTDAAGKLQPTDVITAVNGQTTLTKAALFAFMAKVKPRQTVTLRVLRGNVAKSVQIRTVGEREPDGRVRALIGFAPDQSYSKISLPIKVKIDSGNIGGPSAGLAFTLEVLRRLGQDVTHGYKVAATGAINLDGTVSAIGGVEQKTWGAREAGAQVFLVPVDGGNAREAMKYAGPNLKIIPVTSLDEALRALAALPKLR